jgi:hypothetical protein
MLLVGGSTYLFGGFSIAEEVGTPSVRAGSLGLPLDLDGFSYDLTDSGKK